jgi:Ca-activated chloride channel homolog
MIDVAWLGMLAAAALVSMPAGTGEEPTLRITSPQADAIVAGPTRLEALVLPADEVRTVSFFVNGRLVCTAEQPPFGCSWDAGPVLRGHHVRVVGSFTGGRRRVDNVRTKDAGHVERIRVEAVLVPVIVTHRGRFVRGLQKQDFEVSEDGVKQPVASLASEEAPLDLVLAVDISGSMEHVLPEVKPAVRQLLSKLRPGDAATLIGFNDTTFVVAEREVDPQAREGAVDLLTSWGGTALYDATIAALEMVGGGWGRKAVVIFSDGDDRHSLATRDAAMARVQASDAMVFTVGFGSAGTVPDLRKSLETFAKATGGRAFFPRNPAELDTVFDEIVNEMAHQYVLSYAPDARQPGWRSIKVQVRQGSYSIRARQGYRSTDPQPAER